MVNDLFNLKGRVSIELNGQTVQKIDNLVVTAGKVFVASRMKDATATAMSHMAVGTNSTTHGMCLRGIVKPAADPAPTDAAGSALYLSDTHAGRFSPTAPNSTNDVVRMVGHRLGVAVIYFNPSNDYIVHA